MTGECWTPGTGIWSRRACAERYPERVMEIVIPAVTTDGCRNGTHSRPSRPGPAKPTRLDVSRQRLTCQYTDAVRRNRCGRANSR